jgi:membrane-associated phospholipid phosphatase
MFPILDWGIPINLWLQNLGTWFTSVMEVFTFIGDEQFYLLILPIFVWWVDFGLGLRIGIGLLVGAGVRDFFKLFFGLPRPPWVNPKVKAIIKATDFGFPSGHSLTALVVWGRLAAWLKHRWVTIGLGLLIFLISLSRLALGAHYPTDVLGGWLIGGLLLWVLIRFDEPVTRWLKARSLGIQIITSALASVVILAIGEIAFLYRLTYPPDYTYPPHANPISPDGFITAAGTLLGMGIGGALLIDWGRFRTNVGWPKRIGRYILGVIGLLALYLGLRAIFPSGETIAAAIFRYLRYALLGIWVTYVAPRLFSLVRLS